MGSTFYFQSGPPFNSSGDAISSFTLSSLQSYLAAPQAPSDKLGWGAGLSTSAQGNYFPAGTTPAVSATFDPWWTSQASHLQLAYSVESSATLAAETVPAPRTVPLPTTAAGLASMPLTLPSADTGPGPYEVQASLLDTSTSPPTTVGTTCMPYTVGAPGDRLNLASLPAGAGSGGPADPRGVALDAQLGLSGQRSLTLIDWSSVLPKCTAGAPTAATCGPGAMTFATSSTDPYKAAYLAAADHVAYWMQVSGGDAVSTALVKSGLWQSDVAALVAHYATVPSGCGQCAPVTKWEPWNEANNTGWSNGATYVTSVLKPFYTAVKSVEPGSSSTVIGGSSLEPVPWWWQQVIAAGGLASMDVAAIHPYTGSDDAYEEDGMQTQVRQLQAILAGKPLWFTEVGWWSDGDYNFLAQADDVARSLIWQKVLGVPVENYFFDEGNFGNNGISFSLIQASSSDDYVKPSALATMATSGELAGRPYQSMPSVGIPQTYQADFGPVAGGTTSLAAVWTDGLPVTATVTLADPAGGHHPVTVASEYGAATTVQATSGSTYSLPLSAQVTYLTYPTGDTLTVGPTEPYGTDVASAAAGATATASSGNAVGCHRRTARRLRTRMDLGGRGHLAVADRQPGVHVHHRPDRGRHPVGRLDRHRGAQLHAVGRRTRSRMDDGGHGDGPVPGPRPAVHLPAGDGDRCSHRRLRGRCRRVLRRRPPALLDAEPGDTGLPARTRGLWRDRRPDRGQRDEPHPPARHRLVGRDGQRDDHDQQRADDHDHGSHHHDQRSDHHHDDAGHDHHHDTAGPRTW